MALRDLEIDREYARTYRLAFPEKHREACRKYALSHKEGRKLYSKTYWINNRARISPTRTSYMKTYLRNNLVRLRPQKAQNERKRSAVKMNATIGDITKIKSVYARCSELRKWFNVAVDHVIPLSKGGSHSNDNLQIIYASENSRKAGRIDYIPAVIFS